MHNFSAIMVHAYSHVSGQSLSDSITDLGLANMIDLDEIKKLSSVETEYLRDILKNENLVLSWRKVAAEDRSS